ncbi:SDR family oxidoreductase [Nocardiopsis sp. NPDC050513]|uniref:SDR family oxidoreductase n=1 Tax=Nocardiopsis sp. NPDC050513 TaxID=3364338 RepID=UPI00378C6044
MNETNEGTYLVTGATGRVGGQVVRQLLDAGATNVRALVRDPSAARLPTGVEVVRGDLSDPASLDAALDGVTRVFLVWPTLQADAVAPQVLARITDRVRRVVYLSSMGAGAADPQDPVNGSHARIERILRESGVEWTFVRGGGFAGNDLAWAEEVRDGGVVREAFAGWRRSVVHEADLAAVGVRALTTDDHVGAVFAVTGPAVLSQAERVRIIGEVTGLDLRFEEQTPEEAREAFRAWLPEDAVEDTMTEMATMTRVPEPVTADVAEVLGRPALPYRRWVADHLADFLPVDAPEGVPSTARVAAP